MEDQISWEIIDKNNFSIFIRDLSEKVNYNIKDIIIDHYNLKKKIKNKRISKKELIIKTQQKKNHEKMVIQDKDRLEYFLESIDYNTIYTNMSYFKTKEGIKI